MLHSVRVPTETATAIPPALKPGSQSALRRLNQQRIVEALLSGPLTQAELSRSTGLSTATVSNIVKALTDSGLASTRSTTSSGRRALAVSLSKPGTFAAGIDFGRSHVRVVLVSPGYQVLQEEAIRLPLGHSAREGIAAGAELLDRLLHAADVDRSGLIGAGVGIPGPIDRRSGTVVEGAILPEWVGINVHERLGSRLGVPVFMDNDANLGALAQVTWGPYAAVQNLVFLKIGTGIGTGLILNGAPYYGNIGVTGEIGHATVTDHGVVCRCGNRGCLETVASTAVMISLLSRGRDEPITSDEIVTLARSGNNAALRIIDDAGTAVGRAMANVANLINPEVIVLGGPLAELGDLLVNPVRRGLLRHAIPVVGETTALVANSLGDRAEALGAAALALQQSGFHVAARH